MALLCSSSHARSSTSGTEGEQRGATNLLNTSHATKMYPDISKSKELGDSGETKKMTDTAPNTTDLNNYNYTQPFLPTGGESRAAEDSSGPQLTQAPKICKDPNNPHFACTLDELDKAADMTSINAKTSMLMGKKWKATTQATIVKTRNPGGRI